MCEHMCLVKEGKPVCRCRRGYILNVDQRTCKYTSEFLQRLVSTCLINNGGCEYLCSMIDNRVNCSCPRGYILDTDRMHCIDTACPLPEVQNGVYGRYTSAGIFEKVNETGTIMNKEVLTLRCHKGYAPFPRQSNESKEEFFEAEITCKGGVWSKKLSCHSSSCSYVPRIQTDNSVVNNEYRRRNHGDVITYAFWDDSILVERGKLMCHFGEWIGVSTEVMNNCSIEDLKEYDALIIPKNKTQMKHSEALDILCHHGYLPSAVKLIFCQNGTWKVPVDPCIKYSIACSEFETLSGIEVSYTEGLTVGSYALFSCPSKLTLEGDSYSVCLNNGTWSHSLPSCKESVTCSEFTSSPGLQISYSRGSSVGSKASFSCSSSNTLKGNPFSVCLSNGTWSHPLPSCGGVRSCLLKKLETSSLLIHPIKEKYSFGDVIHVQCPLGHKLTKDTGLPRYRVVGSFTRLCTI